MKKAQESDGVQVGLLKDMFISQLVFAGVSQREIAKVVRVDLNRVNRIGKSLKKRKVAPTGEK